MASVPESVALSGRTPRVRPATVRLPRVFALWHLLSLDAPSVATLWLWFVARSFRAPLLRPELAAMFLAVWILYAVDRLLDSSAALLGHTFAAAELQPRHRFHHHFRHLFYPLIAVAGMAVFACLTRFPREELRLDLILAAALAAWFAIIHGLARTYSFPLPKELVVGLFFAAAVFLPSLLRQPGAVTVLAPALCFGLLCTANALLIHRWECLDPAASRPGDDALTRFLLRRLRPLAALLCLAAVALAILTHGPAAAIAAAVSLSTAALLLLERLHARFEDTDLRALADAALLSPLLLAAWLR